MFPFFKDHIDQIVSQSVTPDKRRFILEEEGPRHYIDLELYGDSAWSFLPRRWDEALEQYGADSLMKRGISPWHILLVQANLIRAFETRDPDLIIKYAAELGHYLSDIHVPLHTTENYNGQLTGQSGIHGLWESRLPELFEGDYDLWAGRAHYIGNPAEVVWQILVMAVQQGNQSPLDALWFVASSFTFEAT